MTDETDNEEPKKMMHPGVMKGIGQALDQTLPPDYLYCLLVLPKDQENTIASYVSSCHPSDLPKALREAADRIESHAVQAMPDEVPPPKAHQH